ncbi:MAG: TolC family protein [Bdellovibrionota bacterium]
MSAQKRRWQLISAVSVLSASLAASEAFALQPLSDFIAAGRKSAIANRIASLGIDERGAQKDQSFYSLFPSVYVNAGYNYSSSAGSLDLPVAGPSPTPGSTPTSSSTATPLTQHIITTPQNQLNLTMGLCVPILNLEAIHRYRSAKAGVDEAKFNAQAIAQQTDMKVAKAYYQFAAAAVGLKLARERQTAAEALEPIARGQEQVGLAPPLEGERAKADYNATLQSVAQLQNLEFSARRQILTLTGVVPSEQDVEAMISSDLPDELPLDRWLSELDHLPSVKSAQSVAQEAQENLSAAKSKYYPQISGYLQEEISNANGINAIDPNYPKSNTSGGSSPQQTTAASTLPTSYSLGYNSASIFQAGVNLTFDFDLSKPAAVRAASAQASKARLMIQQAKDDARDAISSAHEQERMDRTNCLALAEQASFAEKQARYKFGVYSVQGGTLEDTIKARDLAFSMRMQQSQCVAEFAYERALIRIAFGHDLSHGKGD